MMKYQNLLLTPWARPRGLFVSLSLAFALSGCGTSPDQTYRTAPEGEPIKVIGEQSAQRIQPRYPIPKAGVGGRLVKGEFELPEPPDMTSEILKENYVIQSADDQIWLLVNEVPGRVWPAVSEWMIEKGLGIEYENPTAGLIQSDIANFSRRARNLLDIQDEGQSGVSFVQTQISPGVRRKTTEIQVRVRQRSAAPEGLIRWATQTSQMERERDLLEDMGTFLEATEDSKAYSRAALNIDSEPKVRIRSNENGERLIELSLAYDRAWAEVQRALGDVGITVVDRDRSAGSFLVDFRTRDEREGSWWDWFHDPEEPVITNRVALLETDDVIQVRASVAGDREGEDRSESLISKLFDGLY